MALEICAFRLAIMLLAFVSFQKCVIGIARRNNYNISDIEDQCHDSYTTYTYYLGSNNMSSSIKLRAYKKLDATKSLYCHFNIQPPPGYSVVVNLEEFELGFHLKNDCSDAFLEVGGDNFKKKKLCGYSAKGSSFYLGKEAHIYYKAGFFFRNTGFTLVATAYSKGCNNSTQNFKCANGNCIWIGLVKDGVNNCGDNSDETTIQHGRIKPIIKPKPRIKPPPIWINSRNNNSTKKEVDPIMLVIVIISIIIMFIVVFYKLWLKFNTNDGEQAEPAPNAPASQGQAPQRSTGPFTVIASRTNSSYNIAMPDAPPPPYSTVMKEDMKNPPFHPPPPSYSSVISSNSNHTTVTRRKSQLSVSDTENTKTDTGVNLALNHRESSFAAHD